MMFKTVNIILYEAIKKIVEEYVPSENLHLHSTGPW